MFSGTILKPPSRLGRRLEKGAVILSSVDAIVELLPELLSFFYVIERRGWEGVNDSEHADVKLVEDMSVVADARLRSPRAVLLPLGPADFVDTDVFKPAMVRKHYAAIQIARWDDFKRHELFIEAAARLPKYRFLKFGHFADGGTAEELHLRDAIVAMASKTAPNVRVAFAHARSNEALPGDASVITRVINGARMGIVTSAVEGICRFKMECLACDLPVLVPSGTCWPLGKHICDRSGLTYDPTPSGLAHAIEVALERLDAFDPRRYLLETSGIRRSVASLELVLNALSRKEGHEPHFCGLGWNGRNESLTWNDNVLNMLRAAITDVKRAIE